MSDLADRYFDIVVRVLDEIRQMNRDSFQKAAELIAGRLEQDKLIFVYGPGGHSHIGSEEFFYRAGGLVPVYPMFDINLSTLGGARRSTLVERTPGYAASAFEYYGVGEGDVIVITSAYGLNSASVDAGLEAKKRGVKSIAVTSAQYAAATPPGHPARHPSNQNLIDIADVVIDTRTPVGDAVLDVEGVDTKVSPVSTITVSFALQSLVAETVGYMLRNGQTPPVWMSSTAVGGDQANKRWFEQYTNRIKWL